ncbi:PEP-CTERM sorting domain-containing protein [Akkermansiaceae bacterium]|nr:PEP-CTERM sorting domain-containing protein [Akkermansiaceae bacterium]MDA7888046.1 PEP-CTERM sorting domain-containing protein [Akkermansiaceae bacterium]
MSKTRSTIALACLTLASLPADAAVVFATAVSGPNAPSTTTDEITFAGDVSSNDLLHGLVGNHTSWRNSNGAADTGLNDGDPGGDFDDEGLTALNGAAWANEGAVSFSIFELGSGSGLGYDITEIQSIAAWQGAGFSNQRYDVSVRFVGDVTFTALTTVEYQPFPATPNNNGGSTKVNVTDDTGVLASGIEAIRFDMLDTVGANSAGSVYREIDVFGVATIPEPSSMTMLGICGLLFLRRSRK